MKLLSYKSLIALFTILGISLISFSQNSFSILQIDSIIKKEVDNGRSSSIVVGILNNKDQHFICHGYPFHKSKEKADNKIIYEIGSITKIFTTTILADMIVKGELKLSDPVSKYLPDTVKLSEKNDKIITLKHLATHTSGLPLFPKDFIPKDPQNPYNDYAISDIYKFLNNFTLTENIEAGEYSNIGMALLANILCQVSKSNYETLLKERICQPLGMHNTIIMATEEQQERIATPYIVPDKIAKYWNFHAIEGAGAIKSDLVDMLKFLKAQLSLGNSSIGKAIKLTQSIQYSTSIKNTSIGLGWFINYQYPDTIIWHNGFTGGFRSFIGFDVNNQIGTVVLSNSTRNINDIGFHILNQNMKIKEFNEKKVIELNANNFVKYEGIYKMETGDTMHIFSKDSKFYLYAENHGEFEIYPQKGGIFIFDQLPFNLEFEDIVNDRFQTLILNDNSSNPKAKRIHNYKIQIL
jgi:CubicO group peptidase (beta-lactamase class C family)